MKSGDTTLTRALEVTGPRGAFEVTSVLRRHLSPTDVSIRIAFCGVCRSDVHHVRAEFGQSHFPMVPGHEITGEVTALGSDVTRFNTGDRVGVGCMVDSCRVCPACVAGLDQYCRVGKVLTYNARGRDGEITQGGYSRGIVVDERYVVPIPDALPLASAAPLMCAGITVYSPLRRWGVAPGRRVGIVGLGGLGHLGVKIARALDAHTTAITLSDADAPEARRLGADAHITSTNATAMAGLRDTLDLVICTVPLSASLDPLLELLAVDGVPVNLGVPQGPIMVDPYSLFRNRRSMAGSLIGGIDETREMLKFCAEQRIEAEIELIAADAVDDAFDRVVDGNVRYRFVLDCSTI